MDGDAPGILAAGIDAYLTKPLRKNMIGEAIMAHCPTDARSVGLDRVLEDG